jgi:FkbM family methyltransferase
MVKKVFPKIGAEYEAYGFEACAKSYRRCRKQFAGHQVRLIHGAIGSKHGGKIKLYYAKSPNGHSIYSGKANVSTKGENVPAIRFSSWLADTGINLKESFNIIRFNIEGAEWELVNDLAGAVLFPYFNLVYGAQVGKDMQKCDELRDKVDEHVQILDNSNVKVDLLCSDYFDSQRISQHKVMNRISNEYSRWKEGA